MDFPQANTILSWSSRIKNEFKDISQENNQAFDGKKTNLNHTFFLWITKKCLQYLLFF